MSLNDLQVFSQYAYSAMTEILDQQIDLFNSATKGAILLRNAANQGDYSDTAIWAKIQGLVRRRNAYGTGAVSEKNLQQLLDTAVKVAAGTHPVRIDPSMMKWIQRSPEEAGATVGKQLAQDLLADMLNTAIMAYVAATTGQAANVVHNITGATTPADQLASIAALSKTVSKFGDANQSVVCWVAHSKVLFDIYGEAIANGSRLFVFGNVQVAQDGFGRPLVITDSEELVTAVPETTLGAGDGYDRYATLGLVAGGILVDRNNDFTDNIDTKNGQENIERTYQAEWSYNLAVKGYAWDKSTGGKSPNNAALSATANWDRYSTSHKDLAGVMLLSK